MPTAICSPATLLSLYATYHGNGLHAVAVAGLAAALAIALVTKALTGTVPSGAQLASHALAVGLICSSVFQGIGVWQGAGPWSDVFRLSPMGGMFAAGLYLVTISGATLAQRRHPPLAGVLLDAGDPGVRVLDVEHRVFLPVPLGGRVEVEVQVALGAARHHEPAEDVHAADLV